MTSIRAWAYKKQIENGQVPTHLEVYRDMLWHGGDDFPYVPIILDTPEGREAFARMCFEAGREEHPDATCVDDWHSKYKTVDDFIEHLREEGTL